MCFVWCSLSRRAPQSIHRPLSQLPPQKKHQQQPNHNSIFRERLAKLLGPGVSVDMALVSKFRDADGRVLRQLIGDVQGCVR